MTLSSEEIGELSIQCVNKLSSVFSGRLQTDVLEVLALVIASHITVTAKGTDAAPEAIAKAFFQLVVDNLSQTETIMDEKEKHPRWGTN